MTTAGINALADALIELANVRAEYRNALATIQRLSAENARLKQQLGFIISAKRFDRSVFPDDTEFADWACNRLRAAIEGTP